MDYLHRKIYILFIFKVTDEITLFTFLEKVSIGKMHAYS